MPLDRKTLFVIVAAFAVGWGMADAPKTPEPAAARPVVRWIASMAKRLLWVALVAEKPPEPQPENVAKSRAIGGDGYPILDNAEGW